MTTAARRVVVLVLALIGPIARGEDRFVARGRDWWAFRPVRRPDLPDVKRSDWGRNPIDTFVLRAQEEAGLSPSPEADRLTLIRRLSFDLNGLPPSPEEVDAFLADDRPDAYERLVDRLLASPRFGERWATPWLDLARYADSAGFELDTRRPDAWRYRDWVVSALNADMLYDRFVRLQLAADEVEPDRPEGRAALGFLRCGPTVGNQRNAQIRADELDDLVAATSGAFLGLTLACARCHDHKADPIPTEDYYRFAAVFEPARPADLPLVDPETVDRHERQTAQVEEEIDGDRSEILEIERRARDRVEERGRDDRGVGASSDRPPPPRPSPTRREGDRFTPSPLVGEGRGGGAPESGRDVAIAAGGLPIRQDATREEVEAALTEGERAARSALRAKIDAAEARRPRPLPMAPGVAESPGRIGPSYVLIRGDVNSPGEEVRPGPPRAVAGRLIDFKVAPKGSPTTGRRSALADWIADQANPLTARVEVNRIWQGHFGAGLVGTPSDFGAFGDPPTIPGLLDWLADEFVASGWSRKAIHRLIVTSAAYRQASRSRPEARDADPTDSLLWRFPPRRLEAEAIRDAILWCSGGLNDAIGGPGVFPPIDPAVVRRGELPRWPLDAEEGPRVWRRSLYVFRMRTVPLPLLEVFDRPDAMQTCPARTSTTTPPQALALWNGPFAFDQARRFAERVAREAGDDREDRARLAYRLATGHPPDEGRLKVLVSFLDDREDDPSALADLCHVLLNSNDFFYVD